MKDKIDEEPVGEKLMRKSTNISMVVIISFGVIGLIGAWCIMT
jgi:hypothetical protein